MAEDDDPVAGPSNLSGEPSMKKARYVWQIRDHYCLKQPEPEVKRDEEEELWNAQAVVRWQNQQLARAYFDNTVNSVIEKSGLLGMNYSFDNILDDYASPSMGGRFLDEAVEMAIRSHGLHPPCMCPDLRPLPTQNVPFHRRVFNPSDAPSTSSLPHFNPNKSEIEQDVLSEAVAVAIQKKGLGAFNQNGSPR